jgi:hypothetical protein
MCFISCDRALVSIANSACGILACSYGHGVASAGTRCRSSRSDARKSLSPRIEFVRLALGLATLTTPFDLSLVPAGGHAVSTLLGSPDDFVAAVAAEPNFNLDLFLVVRRRNLNREVFPLGRCQKFNLDPFQT